MGIIWKVPSLSLLWVSLVRRPAHVCAAYGQDSKYFDLKVRAECREHVQPVFGQPSGWHISIEGNGAYDAAQSMRVPVDTIAA